LLTNPVDNAVSFSRLGTCVDVVLTDGELVGITGYTLSVIDSGPGIREASLPKLFSRFYSDRPESDDDTHTGLGLAIVKAIVEGYGGACTIGNLPTGGCCFSLVLPKAQ
jgi:signal transduction histidine kinase